MMIISSRSVSRTERPAAARPLMRMRSSGKARRILTMRAIRVSRMIRTTLKMEASKLPPLTPEVPMMRKRRLMTQVSPTIISTRTVSKRNQGSLNALTFRAKALKRIAHSAQKYAQKKFSATMKGGAASTRNCASFRSASTASHMEFSPITARVQYSKPMLLARYCQGPVLEYMETTLYSGRRMAWRTWSFISSASTKARRVGSFSFSFSFGATGLPATDRAEAALAGPSPAARLARTSLVLCLPPLLGT
mmetsp:Transcript_44569/g.126062  ORF Transcript_44569/g.126062 Transcript_44569/m.126062 type:complete len:250 (-) Transcript_44569:118-867(-)